MALPSSLAWLVRGYSRAKGSIERRRANVARLEGLIGFHQGFADQYQAQLAAERAKLAVDLQTCADFEAGLEVHDVLVETREIVAVRPHENLYVCGFGGITKAVNMTIKRSPDGTALTSEIVGTVMELSGRTAEDFDYVRLRVQVRLCIMAKQQKLKALSPNGLSDRRWALPGA